MTERSQTFEDAVDNFTQGSDNAASESGLTKFLQDMNSAASAGKTNDNAAGSSSASDSKVLPNILVPSSDGTSSPSTSDGLQNGKAADGSSVNSKSDGTTIRIFPNGDGKSGGGGGGGGDRNPAQGTDKTGVLKPGDRIINSLDGKRHQFGFISDKDGLQELATGDKLVKAGGMEVLIMPNGDTLVAKKDGSFDLKSKEGVNVKTDKDGGTTLTYPNGDTIKMRDGHITSVSRGDATVVAANNRIQDLLNGSPDVIRKLENGKDGKGHKGGGGGGGGGGGDKPHSPAPSTDVMKELGNGNASKGAEIIKNLGSGSIQQGVDAIKKMKK